MIQFGTGGWRAVIGDGFTRENIRRVAAALARRMQREGVADQEYELSDAAGDVCRKGKETALRRDGHGQP